MNFSQSGEVEKRGIKKPLINFLNMPVQTMLEIAPMELSQSMWSLKTKHK